MEDLYVHCKLWEHEEQLFTRGVYTSIQYKQIETERKQQLDILVRKALQLGEIHSFDEFRKEYNVYVPSFEVRASISQKDVARIVGCYITTMDTITVSTRVDEILSLLEDTMVSLRTISADCAKPFEKWIYELSKKRGDELFPKDEMKFELERVWNLLHASLA